MQRIPASELDDLRSPLRFLLGHTQLEKELTGLALATAPNGSFTLTGQPKGQEKRVTRVALTVTRDGTINGIEVDEADGAITQFTFTDEQPNAQIPAGDVPLHSAGGRTGSGRDAAGVKKQGLRDQGLRE